MRDQHVVKPRTAWSDWRGLNRLAGEERPKEPAVSDELDLLNVREC